MQPRLTSCHVRRQTNIPLLWGSCYHKDDDGKLWVEVIIVYTFWMQYQPCDVLTTSNNDAELFETRTVHFPRLKSSSV